MSGASGDRAWLIASEQQLRALISAMPDCALVMIDPAGEIADWNPGAQRVLGYTAGEIVGRHFSRFYTEPDRIDGKPQLALETAAAEGRIEAEGWRVRKDGSVFWAAVVIEAVRDQTGGLAGYAQVVRDTTDRQTAELELRQAREQLAQAQKMEALGQLTGGVAHDFNNLLMVISGHAQLLRRRVADDPRLQAALDAVDASAQRGQDLTRHLLSFSRRQRMEPVALNLGDQISGLRDLLAASLPSTIELSIDLPADLWMAQADAGELELALLNLAVNARDAMPSGGALTITCANKAFHTENEAGLVGDFVALTVSDTGVGIPPDIMERVFDPFFTTKAPGRGTGLGLCQVHGFAEQSGGKATVRSTLAQGASFTVYLPRAPGEPEQAAAYRDETPSDIGQVSILLVEDNPDVAEVAAGLLEQLGHSVRIVGDGAAALSALQEAAPPDLVFSDIVMPGEIDGIALARRLKEVHPTLPVLLATGYSQTVEQFGTEFPILRKPYRLDELDQALSTLLGARRARPSMRLH